MVEVHFSLVLLLGGIMAALYLLSKAYRPDAFHARMLEHLVFGLFLLLLWNACLPQHPLGINPLSMLLSGSLGLPGAAALLLMRFL